MDEQLRTEFEALLHGHRRAVEDRIGERTAEIDTLRSSRASEFTDDEHDPEGTTLSAEWTLREGLREADAAELEAIDAALDRLRDGTFGRCLRCGRQIPVERLRIRPTATLCVPCAARRDR